MQLALLWHMHQPYYEDLATGEHILPWVRLHAIKDYWGMVALLEEFPRVRLSFNLVPSLLVQVLAFAEDRATDRHLELGLKPAASLGPDERRLLVANGFHAARRMIASYPRYAALHARRHDPDTFTVDQLRDLQVWHKLAWMDPDWLRTDARLTALVARGSGFTEADKITLREVELELLRRVIPAYLRAATRGQVELSTSPFYHPILPLLCDTDSHYRAHPHSSLPKALFRRPEDAREQLVRAIDLHRRLFLAPPQGVWPSEGSVSDAAIDLIAETGCAWTATDEAILARSLGRAVSAESLYRPYEVGERHRPIRCLFRDHGLSDLIGFSYQSWEATAAADDFLGRVRDAGRRFSDATGGEEAIITVILDGENAWEHYPGGGRPFLRALYGGLEAAPDIKTVTMAEAAAGPARRLDSVFPGSWINGDFYIWAGHADDHRAWAQLAAARATFDRFGAAATDRARAREELLIAEGSDWFWWYGDDHSSDHDRDFDDLFRRHLRNVYRALGQPAPASLYVSNITTEVAAGPLEPRTFIEPVIDGRVTGFGEWVGAVPVTLGAGGGTMQRVASELVRELRVGVSRSAVFLRIDGPALVEALASGRLGLAVLVGGIEPRRLSVVPVDGADGLLRAAIGSVIEIAVALEAFRASPSTAVSAELRAGRSTGLSTALRAGPGDAVQLSILITDGEGHAIEQHPASHPIELRLPAADLDAVNWEV